MDACVSAVTSGPDEINCGDIKCGAQEKCCIRPPHEPYCAPADGFCECVTASSDQDSGVGNDAGN